MREKQAGSAGQRSALAVAFANGARTAGRLVGHPAAFLGALLFVVLWAIAGPFFGFNEGWQLVINTGTTILTFLMVFLLQNSQNRDTEAVQLKLDELIRSIEGARNSMVGVEQLDEEERAQLQQGLSELAESARRREGVGSAAAARDPSNREKTK